MDGTLIFLIVCDAVVLIAIGFKVKEASSE